ncbi:hypothetical protein L2E82_35527 [Cichorium intybus]|uniref:Uncharacterized protein n=1 Tax=Cichorium intybus TaxID=13427 RepID=A0ACB9BP29_CICIN|nr:hypothetical protein L2E82_35527 [Cichorium intybus]
MSVPSQLRSTYFKPNFTFPQRRNLFPGIKLSSSENSPSNLLSFGSTMNLNQMLQAKQETRDNPMELSETHALIRETGHVTSHLYVVCCKVTVKVVEWQWMMAGSTVEKMKVAVLMELSSQQDEGGCLIRKALECH